MAWNPRCSARAAYAASSRAVSGPLRPPATQMLIRSATGRLSPYGITFSERDDSTSARPGAGRGRRAGYGRSQGRTSSDPLEGPEAGALARVSTGAGDGAVRPERTSGYMVADEWKPGRVVTLKDVARHADVSISTASRALTGQRNVQTELAARVWAAAEELDYRPNVAARGLRLARTMTIGAVFNRLESPVALEVFDGLGEAAHEHGYSVLVANAGGSAGEYQVVLQRLFDQRVDALVLYRPSGVEAQLQPFHDLGVPVVAVFARGPGSGDLPLVTNGPGAAIAQAVARLAELGHRSLAYLATPVEMRDNRTTHLREESAKYGIEFAMHPLLDDRDHASIGPVVHDVMSARHRPTGLFIRYRHVPGLLQALNAGGLEIPRDVSLVSFGDAEWLQSTRPPIATINVDGQELGRAAGRAVVEWIKGTAPPAVIQPSSAYWVDRASVGPAPA
ncbi:MAG: LacI family DNA-binding transcriptional regulator [Dehalococcoidia bacterium]|nr:LacI family DNA-binding transcriptional regulator [Dehalococcoidia bacterium]